jgi:hypothetical protein
MTNYEMITRLESVVAELVERGGLNTKSGDHTMVNIIWDIEDVIERLKELKSREN